MTEIFKLALSLSLSGSALAVLVFVCCRLLGNHLSKRFQYYIWLVVVLRLVLPFSPESAILPRLWESASPVQVERDESAPVLVPAEPAEVQPRPSEQTPPVVAPPVPTESPANPAVPQTPQKEGSIIPALQTLLPYSWILWLAVAAGLLIRKITLYQSFVKYLRAGRNPVDELETLDRFAALSETMGIRRVIDLYTNRLTASPLILGFRRPAVVLPEIPDNDEEFRLICLHELTHYRRGDIWYKWLLQIVLCLHWFNPLVHLMVREVNRLCEISCDEVVLRALNMGEHRLYGDALLKSLQTPGTYREGLAALTLNESARSLKERLDSIMKFTKPNRATAVLAVVLAALLFTGGYVLGAYTVKPQPAPQDVEPESTFTKKEVQRYTSIASMLMAQARTVFSWYYNELPFDSLWMEFSEPDFEQDGKYYYKVERFKTMAELNAATEQVFTKAFIEANFKEPLENGKFIEKDGELYLGDIGGSGGYVEKDYILRSVTEDEVILTVICTGIDIVTEYSFELVLRKEGPKDPNQLDTERWRVDSYFSYNAAGYQGDLKPYMPYDEPLGYSVQEGSADHVYSDNTGSVVISPLEYEALNEKHTSNLNIGGIIARNWRDANEIEPRSFMYYGAHILIQGGVDIFGTWEDGFIPADTLEPLIQSRFDVSTAHLRMNEYYSTERNAYEFGGLGSTTATVITNAVQAGTRLIMDYDVTGPLDYVIRNGTIEIEFADGDIHGDYYRYISNRIENSAQDVLAFPSAMRETDKYGVFMMESGGFAGINSESGNYTWYNGTELESIIAFYEDEALPALEAQGAAEKTADGWKWAGTYRGGKPLTIDVRHKFGSDKYVISALYDEASPDQIPGNMLEREFMQPPDMSYYTELNNDYLWRPFRAGVLDSSWMSSANADAASLVSFYASSLSPYEENPPDTFPAELVERYVRRYFDVSIEDMRRASNYDAASNTYRYTPNERPEICLITRATSLGGENGEPIRIVLAYNVLASEEEDAAVIWSGEVEVELSDKGYRYLSNRRVG